MNSKAEVVSVPRELLERVLSYTWFPSGEVSVFDLRLIDREQLGAIIAAPAEDVRAVVDEPAQQKLLPLTFAQPHPPRHEGFLQPGREVPGYTIEQMKEYGAECVADFIKQNKL